MRIRPYRPGDASALAGLYAQSVEQLGPRHYSPRQIAAWQTLCPSPETLQAQSLDGRSRLVAVDDADRPLGFIDLAPDGYIQYLYCAPAAAGRGVAGALYAALEREARARGIRRLYAEASEVARGFFIKRGFTSTARREFLIDGVAIHNHAVEKHLVDHRPL